jgi:cbb3-type cytochrome oxidase cytochrome c subunit
MLAYLRARATSSGFLGGSRMWIGIGFVVWTIKFFQWLVRAETEVIYREPLGRGHSVTIHHGHAPPTRRERKKAAKQLKAAAQRSQKDAKVSKRQAQREAQLAEKEAIRAQKQAKQAARAARRAEERAAAS